MAKKIVIIGGGCSGLCAGIYALKSGLEVELYEKNDIIGGGCSGRLKDGYYIDSLKGDILGITEGSELNELWQEVGALDESVRIKRPDNMYTSRLNGESITLWRDLERTEKELISLSPEDEEPIKTLIKYIRIAEDIEIPAKKPIELMNVLEMAKMGKKSKNALRLVKELKSLSISDMADWFTHPLIRKMILDSNPKEACAYFFPISYGSFVKGDMGILEGGFGDMVMRMEKRFSDLGGKIYTNANVIKIKPGIGGRAESIFLSNRKEIKADYFICACDPDYIFRKLLYPSFMDSKLKEMYENREAYPRYSVFQAAFGAESEVDSLGGEIYIDCTDIKTESWMDNRLSVKSFAYESGFSPKGKQLIKVFWPLFEDSYDYWAELSKDEAGYEAKKSEIGEKIRLKLEEEFPQYKNKLTLLDTLTPVSYKQYLNSFKGADKAFVITKESKDDPNVPAKINGLDNVLLTGQWLSPPGGVSAAAIQGRFTVLHLLKKAK